MDVIKQVSVIGGAPTDRLYVDVSSAGGDIWIEGGNGQTTVTLRGIAPLYKYQQVLLTTKSVNQSALSR